MGYTNCTHLKLQGFYLSYDTTFQSAKAFVLYPHIPLLEFALMSWGTASKSRLETVQVKQNKCIRSSEPTYLLQALRNTSKYASLFVLFLT